MSEPEQKLNKPESAPQKQPFETRGTFEISKTEQGQFKPEPEKTTSEGLMIAPEQELEVQKEAERLQEDRYEGRQVEQLLLVAEEKGDKFAEKVAKELAKDDPFLLDKFHDKLAQRK